MSPGPNLFVIGAPKAGTTALQNHLGRHPEVFFAAEKDTSFHARDLVHPRLRPDRQAYRDLFRDWSGERWVGESSVFYLYSAEAPARIRAEADDPRIVALVRNPVELVHSYHRQMVHVGAEPHTDFVRALEAEEDRREGRDLPEEMRIDPRLLRYGFVGTLSPHLRRWRRRFGEEGMRILLFDDLAQDPDEALAELWDWLGLGPPERIPRLSPAERNLHKESRFPWLKRLVRRPPVGFRRLVRFLLPSARLRRAVAGAVVKIDRRYAPRQGLTPAVRVALRERFAGEIAELEELLGRTLEW